MITAMGELFVHEKIVDPSIFFQQRQYSCKG